MYMMYICTNIYGIVRDSDGEMNSIDRDSEGTFTTHILAISHESARVCVSVYVWSMPWTTINQYRSQRRWGGGMEAIDERFCMEFFLSDKKRTGTINVPLSETRLPLPKKMSDYDTAIN